MSRPTSGCRNLSGQRLARLLAEAFSYGADGAEFVVCAPDGTKGAVPRKEVRAKDDVHLVLEGADPMDYVEYTAAAAVAERFATDLATPLETECYFYATGVSIYPRLGWSRGVNGQGHR